MGLSSVGGLTGPHASATGEAGGIPALSRNGESPSTRGARSTAGPRGRGKVDVPGANPRTLQSPAYTLIGRIRWRSAIDCCACTY